MEEWKKCFPVSCNLSLVQNKLGQKSKKDRGAFPDKETKEQQKCRYLGFYWVIAKSTQKTTFD